MDMSAERSSYIQPPLFGYTPSTHGVVELFPGAWEASESLTAPDIATRLTGLAHLQQWGAMRLSPLVAYLVATRLDDPEIAVRCLAARMVAACLRVDEAGVPAPDIVRERLLYYLTRLSPAVYAALLQALCAEPELQDDLTFLFSHAPTAGAWLGEFLLDRQVSIAQRRAAIQLVAQVGFLSAMPALERLVKRLQGRQPGQQPMPFAPELGDEDSLLVDAWAALEQLRAP